MAKKKGGTTELTKVLVTCSAKLTPNQYKRLQAVIFALMNGVTYGYNEMGPYFLRDSNDIYDLHSKPENKEKNKIVKVKQNKDNVIDFFSYKRLD